MEKSDFLTTKLIDFYVGLMTIMVSKDNFDVSYD